MRLGKNSKTPFVTGLFFILIGIIGWLCIRYLTSPQAQGFSDFFKDLSFTIIGLGIVTIVIDLPDWRNYFGERLKEIVIDRKYINTLNDSELQAFQIDILKSKYKDSAIDKEGSFLNYLQDGIQNLINSPYREHVSSACHITEYQEGILLYQEKMSYTIRNVGSNKIDKIKWTWRKDEMLAAIKFKGTLKCPKHHPTKGCCNKKSPCTNGFKDMDAPERRQFGKDEYGYLIEICDYMEVHDGLQVFVELEFTMSDNKLYSWTMAYPTRDINIAIIYPENYNIDRYVGGLDESDYYISSDFHKNTIYFVREGWMLPTSGITFSLTKKKPFLLSGVQTKEP